MDYPMMRITLQILIIIVCIWAIVVKSMAEIDKAYSETRTCIV